MTNSKKLINATNITQSTKINIYQLTGCHAPLKLNLLGLTSLYIWWVEEFLQTSFWLHNSKLILLPYSHILPVLGATGTVHRRIGCRPAPLCTSQGIRLPRTAEALLEGFPALGRYRHLILCGSDHTPYLHATEPPLYTLLTQLPSTWV